MLKLSNFSAVIFDMDGLVLDTETTYCVAWQQAGKQMGYLLSDYFCRSLSGLGAQDIEARLQRHYGKHFDLERFYRLSGELWHEYVKNHGIRVQDGVMTLLDFLNKHKMPYCLATNSSAANVQTCLEFAGLTGVFPTIITRNDVQHSKPLPDIYFKAAQMMQSSLPRCMALEDSHTGIVAAYNAKVFSVFVPSLWHVDPQTVELCNVIVADLNHLVKILRP